MSQDTTASSLCRAAPPAQGPAGSTGREAGGNRELLPGQQGHTALGKSLWEDDMAWREAMEHCCVFRGGWMRRNTLCLPSCCRRLHQRGPAASTWMELCHPPCPPLSSAVTADALNDLPVLPAGTSSRGHSGAAVTVTSHRHSSHLSSACLSLAPLPCPVPAGMSGVGMRFLSPRRLLPAAGPAGSWGY